MYGKTVLNLCISLQGKEEKINKKNQKKHHSTHHQQQRAYGIKQKPPHLRYNCLKQVKKKFKVGNEFS